MLNGSPDTGKVKKTSKDRNRMMHMQTNKMSDMQASVVPSISIEHQFSYGFYSWFKDVNQKKHYS